MAYFQESNHGFFLTKKSEKNLQDVVSDTLDNTALVVKAWAPTVNHPKTMGKSSINGGFNSWNIN